MNVRGVARILGLLLLTLAGAQLLPLVVTLSAGEEAATRGFAASALITAALGLSLRVAGRRAPEELFRRDGVLIVVAAWVLASVTGALPYLLGGGIPGIVDALFESTSGFTTTGASILVDIEAQGRGMLLWRSLTQWLGGIGIIVLFVALLSELGPGARFLFRMEVPGPNAEIMHPRVHESAVVLARFYVALTAVMIAALLGAGASVYDAVTHTFATVSTGGFSPYADSVAHFPVRIQLLITLFMWIAGVNFSLYYLGLRDRTAAPFRDPEFRAFALLTALAIAVVSGDLYSDGRAGGETLNDAVFGVVSVMTTTGFSNADFSLWPSLSQAILITLMVLGGCAGSTAGGAKIVRGMVGLRAVSREVRLVFHPTRVIAIPLGATTLPNESVRAIVSFLVLFGLTWGAGAVLLTVHGTDLVTAATASIATLSNVGPGLGQVGPAGNYAFFATWQKLLMIGLMWLGRLELFVGVALLQRSFWRH